MPTKAHTPKLHFQAPNPMILISLLWKPCDVPAGLVSTDQFFFSFFFLFVAPTLEDCHDSTIRQICPRWRKQHSDKLLFLTIVFKLSQSDKCVLKTPKDWFMSHYVHFTFIVILDVIVLSVLFLHQGPFFSFSVSLTVKKMAPDQTNWFFNSAHILHAHVLLVLRAVGTEVE